ncbi:MAG: sensor histidine kinase [Phycisphaerales bacterium]
MLWLGVLVGIAITLAAVYPALRVVVRRQSLRARLAERRARDAQRMAEIGAMTGGLAHEIKNPLSTIGLNAQLLGESIGELEIDDREKGRLRRRIDALRREVERLRDILQDFLKFAGALRIEPRPTDLNTVVEELADFYMPQAASQGVRLRTELAPGPLTAPIDPPHFKQALLNLMLNATQAMDGRPATAAPGSSDEPQPPRPKELILRTRGAVPARSTSSPRADARAGTAALNDEPAWEVHVIDTGPGIPIEVRERLFTPYFTTKSGGSGLGLATSKRLIEEHGGSIHVESTPGQGTDFTIRIPKA